MARKNPGFGARFAKPHLTAAAVKAHRSKPTKRPIVKSDVEHVVLSGIDGQRHEEKRYPGARFFLLDLSRNDDIPDGGHGTVWPSGDDFDDMTDLDGCQRDVDDGATIEEIRVHILSTYNGRMPEGTLLIVHADTAVDVTVLPPPPTAPTISFNPRKKA